MFKAIFRGQANFDLADKLKDVAVSVEKKRVEIEVAIFVTKTDLYNVKGANSILNINYRKNK